MFQDLDELEGEFFSLEGSDSFAYCTINYGIIYDYNGRYYYLETLMTDETDFTIYFKKLTEPYIDVEDEVKQVDSKYYPNPKRDLIERVFEYDWE